MQVSLVDRINHSLKANIAILLVAVLAINGVIFGFGFNTTSQEKASLSPPGAVVGTVWTVLFVVFGYCRWKLATSDVSRRQRQLFDGFIAICWLYPLYALLPGVDLWAFIANVLVIVVAVVLASRMTLASTKRALYGTAVWIALASVGIAQTLGWIA